MFYVNGWMLVIAIAIVLVVLVALYIWGDYHAGLHEQYKAENAQLKHQIAELMKEKAL